MPQRYTFLLHVCLFLTVFWIGMLLNVIKEVILCPTSANIRAGYWNELPTDCRFQAEGCPMCTTCSSRAVRDVHVVLHEMCILCRFPLLDAEVFLLYPLSLLTFFSKCVVNAAVQKSVIQKRLKKRSFVTILNPFSYLYGILNNLRWVY